VSEVRFLPGARTQSIRTVASLPLAAPLVDRRRIALYQQVSERASHLRHLGFTLERIADVLRVSIGTVTLALAWAQQDEEKTPESQAAAELRQMRLARGLTLTEVARRAGVSKTHLSEVERGLMNATPRMLDRMLAILREAPSSE
jgi:DNA-binding transcriptional regulator YiaG